MGLSTEQIEEFLDLLEAKDIWFAVFFDDPQAVADPLAVEHGGGSYSRPKVTWSRPSPILLRNSNPLSWTGLTPGSVIAAVGGFDAATNGSLRFSWTEEDPVTVGAGGTWTLDALSAYVGIDV